MAKKRVIFFIEPETLEKIDALVRREKDVSRSRFIRRALRAEIGRAAGKKRVTWRDLDDAALDGLAEIIKRGGAKRK